MDGEQAYVSRKPCGCVGIVVMERHRRAPSMVAEAIKQGETVERRTVAEVRANPLRCEVHRRVVERQAALL